MKKSTRRKTTLKQVVEAAHAAGAKVSVGLEPKPPEPVDVEPLRKMAEDLEAIYWLAATRNYQAIKAAHALVRRISYNQCLFILMNLEKEYFNKPVLERPI